MPIPQLVREHRWIVAGSVVVATAAVGATIMAVNDPHRAPAWLGRIPSTATLAGILLAYATIRTNLLNRRDDETAPARLLVVESATSTYSDGLNEDVFPTVVVTLRNASTTATYTDIHIEGVTLNGFGCQQTIRDWFTDNGNPSFNFLHPGGALMSGWVLPRPVMSLDSSDDDKPLQIRYTYVDGNGRRWRRLDKTEPQRMQWDERITARTAIFEQRMRERPNGAGPILPSEIDIKVRSAFPKLDETS